MHACGKCSKIGASLLLVLGVLFLLVDLGTWDFWGLKWWTVLFLYFGVIGLAKTTCKDCMSMCSMPSKKR